MTSPFWLTPGPAFCSLVGHNQNRVYGVLSPLGSDALFGQDDRFGCRPVQAGRLLLSISGRSAMPVPNQPLDAGVPAVPRSPIVLVVDDDPDVGETTATNLRGAGLRVRTALNSDLALDCCRTQPF